MDLDEIASRALGRDVRAGAWRIANVPYQSGSPATGGLHQVHGVTADGQPWSAFRKILQHPRHWAGLYLVAAPERQQFLDTFPWRAELTAWEPAFTERLPPGLRVPRLYRVDDLGDDRLAVWMEHVDTAGAPWDIDRFARAARVLGQFAARSTAPDLLTSTGLPLGHGLRMYAHGPVRAGALPRLADHAWWRHPAVTTAVDPQLHTDLLRLAEHLDEFLDRLDKLPQSLPHGDASPQNLLVPADAPDTFVAIDIAFQSAQAIGFDLGQLLVGLVHAAELPTSALPRIHAVLVEQFVEGMAAEGVTASRDDVDTGFTANLVVRSGFTALPWHTPPDAAADLAERARLTRFIANLGLRMLDGYR